MLRISGIVALSFSMAACTSAPEKPEGHPKVQPYISTASLSFPRTQDEGSISQFHCPAKLDTGAKTSSIHANNIIYQEDQNIVSFEIAGKSFSRPVVSVSKIKRRAGEGEGSEERPVIKMLISVNGSTPIETEVNLANREKFNYPLLIGRNTLEKGGFVIDPSSSEDKPDSPLQCN